jgi:hypothetical protein
MAGDLLLRFETDSGNFRELGPYADVQLRGANLVGINGDDQLLVARLVNGRWQLEQNPGGSFELVRLASS